MRIVLFLLMGALYAEAPRISIDAQELCYDSVTHTTRGTDVTLTFGDGSTLICRHAEVDTKRREGVATEGIGGEPVVYTGLYEDRLGVKRPFVIQAKKMQVTLEPKIEVVTEGSVQLTYDEQVSAFGERATFTAGERITLSGAKARIAHQSGIQLSADHFLLVLKDERVEAQGFDLHVPHHMHGYTIDLSAPYGVWLRREKRFIFPKGLLAKIPSEAELQNEGKVELHLSGEEERPELQKLLCEGTTLVKGSRGETIRCAGKVQFIPGERRLEAKAYKDQEIIFTEKAGQFQADYARIQFAEPVQALQIDKAMLKGRVKLSGLFFLPESISQVAIADEVRLDLKAKKAIFKSSEIQPVLYFDPQQNVQISAPKVVASVRPDGTVSAQGKGNVRFKFTAAELDLLRK